MAELTPLYMDISGAYSGDELGLPYRDILGEGVVGANDLEVTQRAAGANLSVDIAAGAAWVLGDTNADAQPIYRIRNDAVVNKGISPDPSNPRKVIVVAQITDETFAGTGRAWSIDVIHGTPAASPAEPALPDSALKLAVITVPAGAASIVTADISDARTRARVGGGQAQASVAITGRVDSAGTITSGTGFTVVKNATGTFTVTFDAPFASTPIVDVQNTDTLAAWIEPVLSSVSATGFQFHLRDTSNADKDGAWSFFALAVS